MVKRVYYGIVGEGLGHVVRSLAVIERLHDIEVHIFTWGEAYDFLKKQNYPYLHEIAGIPFGRRKDQTISTFKTLWSLTKFIRHFSASLSSILEQSRSQPPDLIISDFDPVLPRLARLISQEYWAIDNQHKFSRCTNKDLPWRLRAYAGLMGLVVETLIPKPNRTIVSTFYHDQVSIRKNQMTTSLVNIFMRRVLTDCVAENKGFILVYYKLSMGAKIIESLVKSKLPCKVYNCPVKLQLAGLEYHELDNASFARDLASCRGVMGGAGNQLVGEAIYFGKPMLTIPEPNQPEQEINAYYLTKMGRGDYYHAKQVTADVVVDFFEKFTTTSPSPSDSASVVAELIQRRIDG